MKSNERYEILKELGKGGMCVVYLAQDKFLNCQVALKVFDPSDKKLWESNFFERFIKEAQVLAKLNHPNIIRIFDVSPDRENPYISMEYIEGQDLHHYMRKKGGLTHKEKVAIVNQALVSLSEIHKANLVHRDIKPGNFMISNEGQLKLMDFGIIKDKNLEVTTTEGIIGTPAYMSPEHVDNKSMDLRSDLFAFAIVIYELFTGKRPFLGDTYVEIIHKICSQEIAPPSTLKQDLPFSIDLFLEKALAKDREERFQTAEEMLKEWRKISNPKFKRKMKPKKRKKTTNYLPLVMSFLFLLGAASYYFLKKKNPVEKTTSIFAICGDQTCSPIEKNCPSVCQQDCKEEEISVNTKQCSQAMASMYFNLSKDNTNLTCGDGNCSFVEEVCGTCYQDCVENQNFTGSIACKALNTPLKNKGDLSASEFAAQIEAREFLGKCIVKNDGNHSHIRNFIIPVSTCLKELKGNIVVDECFKRFDAFQGPFPDKIKTLFECVINHDL